MSRGFPDGNMKRRTWIWVGGGVALVVAIPLCVKVYHGRQEEAAYREQLRFARAEGLPTNAAEFVALIPTAKPSENAAPLYRRLQVAVKTPPGFVTVDFAKLDRALIFDPSAKTVAEVKKQLAFYKPRLDLVDLAVQRGRCWFDRRWQGAATLFPEYAYMNTAAKLVAMRGSLAAHEGRVADAIEDAARVGRMAFHVGEEPHANSRLVRESIYKIGLRNLAYWAFVHRGERAYGDALARTVEGFPWPDLKDEHRRDLYDVLSLVELCSTSEGRDALGLREEDVPKGAEQIFSFLLSRSKSRIKMVEAVRASWAALDRPSEERGPLLAAAKGDLYKALLAFPTAAKVYELLHGGSMGDPPDREVAWVARHQQDEALARALQGPKIPRTLTTHDLRSPFDGKPLAYEFDGKQIRITVSGSEEAGGPKTLKVPPDGVR